MKLIYYLRMIKDGILAKYWIRQRNKLFPVVDITAYNGKIEYGRLQRLIRVYNKLPNAIKNTIRKLHDHKGILSVYLDINVSSQYYDVIRSVWEEEVEYLVYFYIPTPHDGYWSGNEVATKTFHDLAMIYELNPVKKGSVYLMNCPFHNEKTPSFVIDSLGNRAHCFGCGVSFNHYTDLESALLAKENTK